MQELTHNSATVTVQVLTQQQINSPRNANDVDFIVKYPDGYTGKKTMPEGKVVVSKEAADKFIKMGIGYVEEEKKAEPAKESDDTGTKDNPVKEEKKKRKSVD